MRNNRDLMASMRRSALVIAISNIVLTPAMAAGLSDLHEPNELSKLSELDEVLVKSSRDSSTVGQSKRSTAVISRQQLDEQQPNSVAEALKYQPNIEIGGGSRASNQQPVIRGLSGARVLQLADGARQNFNAGHRGTYQVDPELLEQIDVTRGPAGSMWGSGAIGGVVAQTTRDARDMLEQGQAVGGYIKQGFNSAADKTKTSGALYGQLNDELDLLVGGYYSDQHNIRLGNGADLRYSSERDNGALAKLGWQLNDNQRLTLSHRQAQISGSVPGNPATDVVDNGAVIDRESQDSSSILGYAYNPGSELIDMDLSLFRNKTEVNEFRIRQQQQDSTDYQTLGINLINRTQLDVGKLTYGVDGFQDKSQGVRSGANRPIPADGRTQVLGGFLQADLPLAQDWTLTPGLRYDHFETQAKNIEDSKRQDDAWSKSLALSWQVSDGLELVARYDEAFRAPTSEELYTSGTHFVIGGPFVNSFIANPDLKPEQAANKELLARVHVNELLTADDSLTLTASLFENNVTDFIETQVIMDFANRIFESRNRNVQNATLQGGELTMNYRLQDLDVGLSYGRTLGKDNDTGNALEGIPADKWVLGVGYWLWGSQLRLGSQLTYANSVSSETEHYDDYTLLDVGAQWLGRGSLEGVELGLTVDNLTDRYYRRAYSELYEAGRNVKANVRYRF